MSLRVRTKQRLRDLGLELVVPAGRAPGWRRQVRLQRFSLPPGVAPPDPRGVLEVDVDRLVNRAGFGYGPSGWHPYVAALDEHLAEPGRPYEASILARFYDRFRPRTVHDLLLGGTDCPPGPLVTWPAVDPLVDVWSVTAGLVEKERRRHRDGAPLPHSQYRGPVRPDYGAQHLERVVEFHRDARATGYRPEESSAGHITGYFVTDGQDHVFVVGHGNHRAAALSRLGLTRVPVVLRPAHPPVVARAEAARWSDERGGLMDPHEAHAVIGRLLARDDRARAAALGLLP